MPLLFLRPFSSGSVVDSSRILDFESSWTDSTSVVWTPAGATAISTDQVRQGSRSVLFTGGTLTAPNAAGEFALTNQPFTLQLWIRPTVLGGQVCGTWQWQQGYAGGWAISLPGGVPNFKHSTLILAASSAVPLNTWTHVAVCRLGNTFFMYLNGVLSSQITSAITLNSTNYHLPNVFRISGKTTDGGSVDEVYRGYVDNFRFLKGSAMYDGSSFTPT